jgi:hypothetical protein
MTIRRMDHVGIVVDDRLQIGASGAHDPGPSVVLVTS